MRISSANKNPGNAYGTTDLSVSFTKKIIEITIKEWEI